MCPKSHWDDQFQAMKAKIIKHTEIKPYLMCMDFNAYLMKKMFFGFGIIELKDQKDRALIKLHETTIAKKLRLESNFPREASCSRKNAVEAGLIKPKTETATLAHEMCIENVRANTKIYKIIKMQEESLTIEHGKN